MAIDKISTELNSLNITTNSGNTVANETSTTLKKSLLNADYTVLVTVLEKIIVKLDEITDKVNE
mgnify:FL=1|jgi:hypothetical protein|tara:strand:- start:7910 stop:8101 length:192 start_codon:yes stop_codon:yes gene_type:complete